MTLADGEAQAAMTLAAGYELRPLARGQTAIRRAGVPGANLPATYNAQQAALCGAAHFADEQWGEAVLTAFLQASPEARQRAIEDRFADEAKAALTQFGLPLHDYIVEITLDSLPDPGDRAPYGGEIEADVYLTHHTTGATISLQRMCLSVATGELMTPSHPDHEGTGMLLFP